MSTKLKSHSTHNSYKTRSKIGAKLRILIIEDCEDDALLIIKELQRGGFDPAYKRVDTLKALDLALERPWDIITGDYAIPGMNGLLALNLLKAKELDTPFIIVSGKIGEELAVEAIKGGARDYVPKKHLAKLAPTIARELREAEVRQLRKQEEKLDIALNEINRLIMTTLDLDQIMPKVVEQAALAMKVDSCAIALPSGEGWIIKARFPKELTGQFFNSDDAPLLQKVLKNNNNPLIINDAAADERIEGEIISQYKLESLLALPLFIKKELIGVLVFSSHSKPLTWSKAQIDFANKLSASIALAIKNSSLYKQQCKIAETLQKALLTVPNKIHGLDFAYLYESATDEVKIGGDFYKIFELKENLVGIILGDVSGKGLEAATLAAKTRNIIKAYAFEDIPASAVMTKTNNLICKEAPAGMFVTAIYAILDTKASWFTYCSAGHPPPIIRRNTGVSMLKEGSTPLGVLPSEKYVTHKITLDVGDTLVLYTDGITEARRNGECFGEERLLASIDRSTNSPKGITETIFKEIMNYTKGHLSDDLALLSLSLSLSL